MAVYTYVIRLATPDISHLLTSYTWWNHPPQVDPPADRSQQHLRCGTTSIALPIHLGGLGIVNPCSWHCQSSVWIPRKSHILPIVSLLLKRKYQWMINFRQKRSQGRLTSSYKPEQSKKSQSWWENKEKCAIWSGEGCIHLADRCSSVKEWFCCSQEWLQGWHCLTVRMDSSPSTSLLWLQ